LKTVLISNAYADVTPTHLDGGITLSSQHTLDCLKDPFRIIRLIKATYFAILDSNNRFSDEK